MKGTRRNHASRTRSCGPARLSVAFVGSALVAFAWLITLALPAQARDLILNPPIDCTLGKTCFIQNYVDQDPGPGAADYTCGGLSNDGHKGTDFALPDLRAMARGVNVLAAAPGVVRAMRDRWPDIAYGTPGAPDLQGQDCGNGVVISHGGGWETQYCHLKLGSITVRPGDRVTKGAVLGQVGLSGRTQFPHVHLSLRHKGKVVDPFDPDMIVSCAAPPAHQMWQTPIAYVPGGLIAIGIATHMPDFTEIKAGPAQPPVLPAKAPALVLWAHIYGGEPGDVLAFSLRGPRGVVVARDITLTKAQARLFRAVGKRQKGLGPAGWPAGRYMGEVRLMRGGKQIGARSLTLRIEG